MKKRIKLLAIFCLYVNICVGQKIMLKPLKIGEKVPEIFFDKVLNYTKSSLRLSDLYKNKFLLLDLWNVYCESCIAEMPRMQALQKEMHEVVNIMPVSTDASLSGPYTSPETFFSNRRKQNRNIWPSIVLSKRQLTIFNQLFPCDRLPGYIWIDANGIYRGVTLGNKVTSETINLAIKGRSILSVLATNARNYKPEDKFIIPYARNQQNHGFGSVITNFNDTIGRFETADTNQPDSTVTRIYRMNMAVPNLYLSAFSDSLGYLRNKRYIVIPGALPFYKSNSEITTLKGIERAEAERQNYYCYELILPKRYTVAQAKVFMINDLDRYLNIHSSLEKRKVKGLALISTAEVHLDKSGKFSMDDDFEVNTNYLGIKSTDLCRKINTLLQGVIVFDEMNYHDTFDISLRPGVPNNLNAIRRELRKCGLDLVEKEFELNMVVLKDLRN